MFNRFVIISYISVMLLWCGTGIEASITIHNDSLQTYLLSPNPPPPKWGMQYMTRYTTILKPGQNTNNLPQDDSGAHYFYFSRANDRSEPTPFICLGYAKERRNSGQSKDVIVSVSDLGIHSIDMLDVEECD